MTPTPSANGERWHLYGQDGRSYFEPRTENVGQGGRLGFLRTDAWLDDDGQHVWSAHDCLGERVVTMLPWPNWQGTIGGEVRPSFSCERCGTHAFLHLNRRVT